MIHPRHALSRSLATLLATPLLLLTACGGSSPSATDPPTTVLPTPSPTAQAPAKPETADHFIRRFYEAERKMENTGITAPYAALTRRCEACSKLIAHVKRIYAHGGYIHWNGLTVLSVKPYGREGDGTPIFEVKTDSTPTRYKESSSATEQHLDGGVSRGILAQDRHGSSWLVTARSNLQ